MSTITSLTGSDGVTTANSMTKLNANFSNLNTDKIETSVLDTDTTLAANSDAKIATQKAVKAYVDAGGNVNASETTKGIVEEATDAEVTAGTSTGGTGAKLFVTPAKLATRTTAVLAGIASKPAQIVNTFVTTTAVSAGSSATTTTDVYTETLAAGFFGTTTGFKVKVFCTPNLNAGNTTATASILIKLGGTTINTTQVGSSGSGTWSGDTFFEIFVLNSASLSSQIVIPTVETISGTAFKAYAKGTAATSAVNTTGAVDLVVTFSVTGGSLGSASLTNKSIIVEKISK